MDIFNQLPESQKYIRGLMAWIGLKQLPFYYDRQDRTAGSTKYTWSKMSHLAFVAIFYFSKMPLKIASVLGFFCMGMGLIYSLMVIIQKIVLEEPMVWGWPSLMIMIIFFGGIQLLTIGILGEFLGNTFEEVKKRPRYIIKS